MPSGLNGKNCASSHKTNYFEIYLEILNLEGHLNHCICSEVAAILLNGWILPTGGVATGRVCPAASAAGLFINNSRKSNQLNVAYHYNLLYNVK